MDKDKSVGALNPDRHNENPFGNGQTLKRYIIENHRPLDWNKIVTLSTRVFCVGETHPVNLVKTEIIEALPVLAQLGFTHLGMEVFATDEQSILDEAFKTQDYSPLKPILLDWQWRDESADLYTEIVKQAHSVGIKVFGLDMPGPEDDKKKGFLDGKCSKFCFGD